MGLGPILMADPLFNSPKHAEAFLRARGAFRGWFCSGVCRYVHLTRPVKDTAEARAVCFLENTYGTYGATIDTSTIYRGHLTM